MGLFVQMSGLSGSGKSTLAYNVAENLVKQSYNVEIIDGDIYRLHLCKGLGFSEQDRKENIKRLSFVGRVLAKYNIISIMSAINPYQEIRQQIKSSPENTKLVYVKCSLQTLIRRDTKGLYKRALLDKTHPDYLPNFTGISDTYEIPEDADLVIDTDNLSIIQAIDLLEGFIIDNLE